MTKIADMEKKIADLEKLVGQDQLVSSKVLSLYPPKS
jgi:hypothetical protein